VILAAIIALGAGGLILMLLAIANPRIDDDARDPAATNERVPLRVVTRTDGVPPARRYARPAMEVRTAVTRVQEPPRRPAAWKSWWRRMRDPVAHGYPQTRRKGILASPDARFVAGTVACSLAVGLLIAHLSV
jgi:hypothetical protein